MKKNIKLVRIIIAAVIFIAVLYSESTDIQRECPTAMQMQKAS